MCLVQIIRCLGATHLRRDPAWLQCIREDPRPTSCDTKGEEHVMQLRVGVGLFSVPCASLPCQVLRGRIAVLVKHGAEIDESLRLRDQGCHDVGSNSVDREDMRETIFRLDSLRLLVADGSIVDDGVERAERIDLLCDLSSLGNCAEIADNDCLRLRDVPLCLVGAGLASGVQDDPVTLLNQQLRCHPAEAISRSGDEYACHSLAPSYLAMICCECQGFSDRSLKIVSQS